MSRKTKVSLTPSSSIYEAIRRRNEYVNGLLPIDWKGFDLLSFFDCRENVVLEPALFIIRRNINSWTTIKNDDFIYFFKLIAPLMKSGPRNQIRWIKIFELLNLVEIIKLHELNDYEGNFVLVDWRRLTHEKCQSTKAKCINQFYYLRNWATWSFINEFLTQLERNFIKDWSLGKGFEV